MNRHSIFRQGAASGFGCPAKGDDSEKVNPRDEDRADAERLLDAESLEQFNEIGAAKERCCRDYAADVVAESHAGASEPGRVKLRKVDCISAEGRKRPEAEDGQHPEDVIWLPQELEYARRCNECAEKTDAEGRPSAEPSGHHCEEINTEKRPDILEHKSDSDVEVLFIFRKSFQTIPDQLRREECNAPQPDDARHRQRKTHYGIPANAGREKVSPGAKLLVHVFRCPCSGPLPAFRLLESSLNGNNQKGREHAHQKKPSPVFDAEGAALRLEENTDSRPDDVSDRRQRLQKPQSVGSCRSGSYLCDKRDGGCKESAHAQAHKEAIRNEVPPRHRQRRQTGETGIDHNGNHHRLYSPDSVAEHSEE